MVIHLLAACITKTAGAKNVSLCFLFLDHFAMALRRWKYGNDFAAVE